MMDVYDQTIYKNIDNNEEIMLKYYNSTEFVKEDSMHVDSEVRKCSICDSCEGTIIQCEKCTTSYHKVYNIQFTPGVLLCRYISNRTELCSV
jgi:hypothetical protein